MFGASILVLVVLVVSLCDSSFTEARRDAVDAYARSYAHAGGHADAADAHVASRGHQGRGGVVAKRAVADYAGRGLLGAAASFAMLGKTSMTNIGASVIVGDRGSEGAQVGFAAASFTGVDHGADAVTSSALASLTTLRAMALTETTSSIIAQLGAQTLLPGAYSTPSGAFLLTGTLTFDGLGNTDSVFIIRADSTVTTASSSVVVLVNGAQACNIYWFIGSSMTTGTNSILAGNVIAQVSVTLTTSSSLSGALFALTGSITIDQSSVIVPACSVVTVMTSTSTSTGSTGATTPSTSTSTGSTGETTLSTTMITSQTSTMAATTTTMPASTTTSPPMPAPTPCTGACGDVHVTGFRGQTFDFNGLNRRWHTLFADSNILVNVLLVFFDEGITWDGSVIRAVAVTGPQRKWKVLYNEDKAAFHIWPDAIVLDASLSSSAGGAFVFGECGSARWTDENRFQGKLRIEIAGYVIDVLPKSRQVKGVGLRAGVLTETQMFLDVNVSIPNATADVSGFFGDTWRAASSAAFPLRGEETDYVVSGPFESNFRFSAFDATVDEFFWSPTRDCDAVRALPQIAACASNDGDEARLVPARVPAAVRSSLDAAIRRVTMDFDASVVVLESHLVDYRESEGLEAFARFLNGLTGTNAAAASPLAAFSTILSAREASTMPYFGDLLSLARAAGGDFLQDVRVSRFVSVAAVVSSHSTGRALPKSSHALFASLALPPGGGGQLVISAAPLATSILIGICRERSAKAAVAANAHVLSPGAGKYVPKCLAPAC